MQVIIPKNVGIKNASAVHFRLPDSFLIVIRVVEQGKCIKQKSITFIAVKMVQPLLIKILEIFDKSSICIKLPPAV